MNHIPKRLRKEPLIEAIWQVQFDNPGAGEASPGLLYAMLRKDHPNIQLYRLPTADIPVSVAQLDPVLRLAAKIRLVEPGGIYFWQVGDRVVTLNCRKPYAGWAKFSDAIKGLTRIIEDSGLVPQPQRHSLRYIDLLTLDEAPDISAIQLDMKIGAYTVQKHPLQLRLELQNNGVIHVVQIATPAQVQLPEGPQNGSVIDLETFINAQPANWDDVRKQIDVLHDHSKGLFFEQLLTKQAIEKLDPED